MARWWTIRGRRSRFFAAPVLVLTDGDVSSVIAEVGIGRPPMADGRDRPEFAAASLRRWPTRVRGQPLSCVSAAEPTPSVNSPSTCRGFNRTPLDPLAVER